MAEVIRSPAPIYPTVALPVISSSVDWLTCTVKPGVRMPFAQTAVERWQKLRSADGFPIRSYAANGYLGHYVDGITWGERDDGAMLRLSGEMAGMYVHAALMWAHQVSRIDFQVTVHDTDTGRDWVSLALNDFKQDERVKSGMTQYQIVRASDGGATVYLGRRSSSRFYRIYDKTAESDGLYPPRCWRFEVEYKAPRSQHWGSKVLARAWTPDDTRSVVASAFSDYGFVLPAARLGIRWSDSAPREPTTDERRLQYLRKMIRPMIAKLKESYDADILMDALGIYDNAEQDVGGPET